MLTVPPARASVIRTDTRRSEVIRAAWLEYRVAAQYGPIWDRAVEQVELVRRLEGHGQLPTQDTIGKMAPSSTRGGSPAYWIQQVDVPGWFVADELGIGTSKSIVDTQRTLARDNLRRREQYERQVALLDKARKVLARKVST